MPNLGYLKEMIDSVIGDIIGILLIIKKVPPIKSLILLPFLNLVINNTTFIKTQKINKYGSYT